MHVSNKIFHKIFHKINEHIAQKPPMHRAYFRHRIILTAEPPRDIMLVKEEGRKRRRGAIGGEEKRRIEIEIKIEI